MEKELFVRISTKLIIKLITFCLVLYLMGLALPPQTSYDLFKHNIFVFLGLYACPILLLITSIEQVKITQNGLIKFWGFTWNGKIIGIKTIEANWDMICVEKKDLMSLGVSLNKVAYFIRLRGEKDKKSKILALSKHNLNILPAAKMIHEYGQDYLKKSSLTNLQGFIKSYEKQTE